MVGAIMGKTQNYKQKRLAQKLSANTAALYYYKLVHLAIGVSVDFQQKDLETCFI